MTALDLYVIQENGPYDLRGEYMSCGQIVSLAYQPGAMRHRGVAVFTNTHPMGAQRGPGGAQITGMLEPIMDKAARELGIDRLAIRRINAPDSDAVYGPDRTPISSAFVREALDKGAELFGWEERLQRSGQRNGTKVTGVGIGLSTYSAGSREYDGLLVIRPDGKLYILPGHWKPWYPLGHGHGKGSGGDPRDAVGGL